jgi:hypothetical protein
MKQQSGGRRRSTLMVLSEITSKTRHAESSKQSKAELDNNSDEE